AAGAAPVLSLSAQNRCSSHLAPETKDASSPRPPESNRASRGGAPRREGAQAPGEQGTDAAARAPGILRLLDGDVRPRRQRWGGLRQALRDHAAPLEADEHLVIGVPSEFE